MHGKDRRQEVETKAKPTHKTEKTLFFTIMFCVYQLMHPQVRV
jgi:hypothetical protein